MNKRASDVNKMNDRTPNRRQRINHPLEPVFDDQSKILILGTMPSPKSRETGFYYGHPQNRFWILMAQMAGQDFPVGVTERKNFLLRHRIALWDVLESCLIEGADDSSISEPHPNDLHRILDVADIQAIFTTGHKATELYSRYCRPATGRDSIYLPSTSPANRALPTARLVSIYQDTLAAYGFHFNI